MEGVYWQPSTGRNKRNRIINLVTTMLSSPPQSADGRMPVPLDLGGDNGQNNNPLSGLIPFTQPSLIIWFSPDCAACKMSNHLFDALERNQAGLTVFRMEATPAVINRYRSHITTLPLYDFVFPYAGLPAVSNPLGIPNVLVHSVRNNDVEALKRLVPYLNVSAP